MIGPCLHTFRLFSSGSRCVYCGDPEKSYRETFTESPSADSGLRQESFDRAIRSSALANALYQQGRVDGKSEVDTLKNMVVVLVCELEEKLLDEVKSHVEKTHGHDNEDRR